MAVVYKSDLENVDNYVNSILNNENNDTQQIIDAINDFINTSSNTLKGAAWDKERERMASFITSLESRKKVASSLLNSILSADAVLLDYLNAFPKKSISGVSLDFNKVDTEVLDQLRAVLSNARIKYDTIKNQFYSNTADSKASQSNNNFENLAEYDNIINSCETLIKYIEELPDKDAVAYAKYDGINSELNAFKSSINDISNI